MMRRDAGQIKEKNMTEEELSLFATVADKAKVFFDDFAEKNYHLNRSYTEGSYVADDGTHKMWVIFESRVYMTLEGGVPIMVANGFAREEQGASAFNKVNYFMTAQTKADGRAFSALGILIDKGMASGDEIEASEVLVKKEKIEEQKKNAPKAKSPSMRSNLKRLRVKFEENKYDYVIENYKNYSEKTMTILKKYGFQEVDNKLIAAKELDES